MKWGRSGGATNVLLVASQSPPISIPLRSQGPAADIISHEKVIVQPLAGEKNGEAIHILDKDTSLVAMLPKKNGRVDASIPEAYAIAAAPQLLEICTRLP